MTEYEILSYIHKNGNFVEYSDLIKESVFSDHPDIMSDDLRYKYLSEEGYIHGTLEIGGPVTLTHKGIARLDELTKQQKEKREQRRHEWVLAIFSALAGALLSEPLWAIINAITSAGTP